MRAAFVLLLLLSVLSASAPASASVSVGMAGTSHDAQDSGHEQGGLYADPGLAAQSRNAGMGSTRQFRSPSAGINFDPEQATVCDPVIVNVNFANVSELYGYQFALSYDDSLVSASASFVDAFFDTGHDASIPPGWDAACAGGVCRFAVSKLRSGLDDNAVSGSGTVAQVEFARLAPGPFDLAIMTDILATREAQEIAHSSGTATLVVCYRVPCPVVFRANASPAHAGAVGSTAAGDDFLPISNPFDALAGAFLASVP